jgi:hypothetical protein
VSTTFQAQFKVTNMKNEQYSDVDHSDNANIFKPMPDKCAVRRTDTVLTLFEYSNVSVKRPIPVAARSKAWVFGRSFTRIVGLNPTEGMDVCLL